MVIEDSEAGVRAGKAAGMTVLGCTGGSNITTTVHGPRLVAAGADLVFDAVVKLPDLLSRRMTERSRLKQVSSNSR